MVSIALESTSYRSRSYRRRALRRGYSLRCPCHCIAAQADLDLTKAVEAMRHTHYSKLRLFPQTIGGSGLLAVLPSLTGCDYAQAVVQNIAFGIRDCVNEAGLSGCTAGGDPVELLMGALINGALYGVQ